MGAGAAAFGAASAAFGAASAAFGAASAAFAAAGAGVTEMAGAFAAAGAAVGATVVVAGAAGVVVAGAAGAGGGVAGVSPKSLPFPVVCSRAVRIAREKVMTKRITASQTVNFCSTFVVCAPQTWLVMESPKEAPRPSCRGRCMRTMRIRRRQTITSTTVRIPINIRDKEGERGGHYGGAFQLGKCHHCPRVATAKSVWKCGLGFSRWTILVSICSNPACSSISCISHSVNPSHTSA